MNKKLVLLLALIMVLSVFSPVLAEGENLPEKVQWLVDQKIVDGRALGDGTVDYALDEPISREEVTKLLTLYRGLETEIESHKTVQGPFTDVAPSRWSNGNINVAVNHGFVNGYPDKTFKPANTVSIAEMMAMLVRMDEGWTKVKEEGAKWPDTYVEEATKLGINEGIVYTDVNQLCKREMAFDMMYNAFQNKGKDEEKVEEEKDEFTVSFVLNYEGAPKFEDKSVKKDEAIGELPKAYRDDHTFSEWNTKKDGTGDTVTKDTVVTEDMTLFVIWRAGRPVEVTFDYNFADGPVYAPQVMYTGGPVTDYPPKVFRENYDFKEWNTKKDGSGDTVDDSYILTEDVTLYGIWDPKMVTVKFNSPEPIGGGVYIKTIEIPKGSSFDVLPEAEVFQGYTFDYWEGHDGQALTTDTKIEEDTSFNAIYK